MKKALCVLGVLLLILSGTTARAGIASDLDGSRVGIPALLERASMTQGEVWSREDLLQLLIEIFIAIITSDGPLEDLLYFTSAIAVGVERSAAGIEDNPLTDLIEEVREAYGDEAAAAVEHFFDRLVAELGPELLADVDPIVLPPQFDVNNGRPDETTVSLPTGAFILDIGTTENVGDREFCRIVLGLVDSDDDDNDAEQLLNEIVTGTSGANLDFEWKPGIVGVDLVDISPWSFTLALEDGDYTDLLTLSGPGTRAVIARLDAPASIVDFGNSLSLVEVGVEEVDVGPWFRNPIFDLVGRRLDSAPDVAALLDAAHSGDERVELIGFDDKRLSVFVHNGETRTSDLLILFGRIVEVVCSGRR